MSGAAAWVRSRVEGAPVRVADPTVQYDDRVLLSRTRAATVVEVPPVGFTFRSAADRLAAGEGVTAALAGLRDGLLDIRTVHGPADVEAHARRVLDAAAAGGAPSPRFEEHVRAGAARRARMAPWEKRVFWEVDLGARGVLSQGRAAWVNRRDPLGWVPGSEMAAWGARAEEKRRALAESAVRAVGVDARTVRALRRRAVERGALAVDGRGSRAGGWGRAEVVDEWADLEVLPGPRWVRVVGPQGEVLVATLTVSAMPTEMSFPGTPPWLAVLDRLDGFTVDSDLRLQVRGLRAATEDVRRRGRLAREQRREAQAGGADHDDEVAEMEALARSLAFDMPLRRQPLAYGWARVRVEGSSVRELDDRCRQVADRLGSVGGSGIDVRRLPGQAQADLLFEGVPGVPVRQRSFRQRWTLPTVGCALPQAGSTVGHPAGAYRGWTTGRQRTAVRFEVHHAITEQEGEAGHTQRGGGIGLFGDPRAGKSGALAEMIVEETIAGRPVEAIDGAVNSPLARLADLPDLAGRVSVLDLADLGGGGVDPMGPALLPWPVRSSFGDDGAFEVATRRVRGEREHLMREVIEQIAHRSLRGPEGADATTAMLHAIKRVGGSGESSFAAVVADLGRAESRAGRNLAALLDFELSGSDSSALAGEGAVSLGSSDAVTRILTMRSLSTSMPDVGKPLAEWSPSESLAAATFSCAVHLVRRSLFEGERRLRTFAVDEAHNPLATAAGSRAIDTSLRHGPKLGIATILSTHNALDFRDPRLSSGISTWMLFRSANAAEVSASHAVSGLADTAANREHRRTLRNGECITVWDDGQADRMQWDQGWVEGLAEAANTTPKKARGPRVVPVEAPVSDDEVAEVVSA